MAPLILLAILCGSKAALTVEEVFKWKHVGDLQVFPCHKDDVTWLRDRYTLTKLGSVSGSLGPSHFIKGFYVDLTCPQINLRVLKEAEERKMFNLSYSWVMKVGHLSEAAAILDPFYLPIDSDVALLPDNAEVVIEVFQASLLSPKRLFPWRPGPTSPYVRMRHRWDLEGAVLRGILMFTTMPYHNMTDAEAHIVNPLFAPGLDSFVRKAYAVNRYMSEIFNYRIHLTDIMKHWGDSRGNCQFDGVIGNISKGLGDISIIPLHMREARMCAIDYLQPMDLLRVYAVFLEPKALGTSRALALPFSGTLWITIMAFVALLLVYSYFSEKILTKRDDGFSFALLFTLGSFAQQGVEGEGRSGSSRVFAVTLFFFAILIDAYYDSAIMNALLSPSPNTIRTLDALLKSPIKVAFLDAPYMTHKPNLPIFFKKELVRKMQMNPKGVVKMEEGMKLVRRGRFALCAEMSELYAAIEGFSDEEKCDTRYVTASSHIFLTNVVTKSLPYREHMRQGHLRVLEVGLGRYAHQVWYPPRPSCLGSQSLLHISLEAVSIALAIYFLGIVVSFILLAIEILTLPKKRGEVKRNTAWVSKKSQLVAWK